MFCSRTWHWPCQAHIDLLDRVLLKPWILLLQVLARIWRCDDATALNIAQKLAAGGFIRYATLQNGAVWCVLNADYAAPVSERFEAARGKIVDSVLAAYERRKKFTSWVELPDDGFIMLHVVALLAEAGRFGDMRCVSASASAVNMLSGKSAALAASGCAALHASRPSPRPAFLRTRSIK